MRQNKLNIIEPTLRDQTGHCFSLVSNVLSVSEFIDTTVVWLHKDADRLFYDESIIERRYFSRRIRKFQVLNLYRKLLGEGQKIFVPTATATDLLLIGFAIRINSLKKKQKRTQVKVYIHWLYPSKRRMRRLRKVASRNKDISIACPTEQVRGLLHDCGFQDVRLIPYPMTAESEVSQRRGADFRRALVAGAARMDKGFPLIVDLIACLDGMQSSIPILVQCSPTHKGSHPEDIQVLINRLTEINYAHQESIYKTVDQLEYKDLFFGAIVLQPYQAEVFANRVSGVTLDALCAGSPVITIDGTWISSVVRRFDAGIVLAAAASVTDWVAAIETIIEKWQRYSANAYQAGEVLTHEHKPENMIQWLCE